jgi:hypothetical protein
MAEKAARWVRKAGVAMAWNWRREVARMKDIIAVVGWVEDVVVDWSG